MIRISDDTLQHFGLPHHVVNFSPSIIMPFNHFSFSFSIRYWFYFAVEINRTKVFLVKVYTSHNYIQLRLDELPPFYQKLNQLLLTVSYFHELSEFYKLMDVLSKMNSVEYSILTFI